MSSEAGIIRRSPETARRPDDRLFAPKLSFLTLICCGEASTARLSFPTSGGTLASSQKEAAPALGQEGISTPLGPDRG